MIKKILIVDDSPVARKMLKRCLPEGGGYDLIEAGDGREGVEAFRAAAPDVTFLDLTMPVMDGMEALREIRGLDGDAVVVVNTADVQVQSINGVMEAGATAVLNKPPTREKVSEALAAAAAALNARRGG